MALTFDLVPNTTRTPATDIAAIFENPGFVNHFSDHMAIAEWTSEGGWDKARVVNYGPFPLAPGAAVLHYGQEIFEGLKVYRHADGSLWSFRPEMNARRFIKSCERMALPTLPEEDFLASILALIRADEAWVPSGEEMSYYVRPYMFASDAFLGVHAGAKITYAVIGGPAGAYFSSGLAGVDIWVTTTYSRAGEGGTGAAKCGGNYASSLIAQQEGAEHGCSQVLFSDAASHEWVEELGGMNFFAVTTDGRLVTPPTSGTILDGVTRNSVLTLAPEFGLTPDVRPLSLSELYAGIDSGTIVEAFACGTAAVITPITSLVYEREGAESKLTLPNPEGEKTLAIRAALVDIQWGRAEDRYGWMHKVSA
ncbi:MAG: branched-chain amino acid aminotransferase [Propionibacteriaceae bacterium]|jgi:branched-chain amino acid aminotransferase|nr:branched-chain amino acid aminotransferase [Propionibacteriaceae bacterium]